jgi:hypothetical protein
MDTLGRPLSTGKGRESRAAGTRGARVTRPPRAKAVPLRIELLEVAPLVWRRVLVPDHWTLASLHQYLQWVMGWTDSHAHEFEVGEGLVAPDWWIEEAGSEEDASRYRDERRVSVAAVLSELGAANSSIATTWEMVGSTGSSSNPCRH